ncbi:hypothetical protein [Stenotrophomonas maltophilia]|uniref:hypothetical protein n=1 Tax=Stenotrophomonas maltophilia TaxID=40324 RepID=UPI002B1D2D36|nr:hypothetical protein [Stenotrophomonas maltophilia]
MQIRKFHPVALAAAVLALAACGEKVQHAPKVGDDIHIDAFTWRVRSAEQIAIEYRAAGKAPGAGQAVAGYIGTLNGAPIITTQSPRYVDDAVACTLGHEVMHAALGDYHVRREAR